MTLYGKDGADMNKRQRIALWIGTAVLALYGITWSPHKPWRSNTRVSPTPRGNLFKSTEQQNYVLDTGRFAVEAGFIVVVFGGIVAGLGTHKTPD